MSSLLNWLDQTVPPSNKKQKTTDKKATQAEYDKNKRERNFQPGWTKTFTWLLYDDNEMHCKICREYDPKGDGTFIKGSKNFRLDPIKKHDSSESHRRLVLKDKAQRSAPGSSVADQTLMMMSKASVDKLSLLFRTAHYVAKARRPYTDYVKICELDESKGIDLGKTYRTDKYCQKFIAAIAETCKNDQKQHLEAVNVPFVSIISDGSTDSSSKETEIVYVRSSQNCKVSTLFVGLKHVGKADAPNITRAISSLLDQRFVNWREKLIAMGTDGAAVMLGKKNGVVKRMAEETNTPFLKAIHCSAHRLELAYKDATKNIALHQKCELLLTNLYLFYKYSPLNRANLKLAADTIGKKLYVPSRTGGTRWLPHSKRALKNVKEGLESIVLHLEQMQQNPMKESSNKAKNFLKLLHDKSIIYWLHLMMDVVQTLSFLSQAIQEKDSTTADVYNEIESAKIILAKYKNREVEISNEKCPLAVRKNELLDKLIHAISDRFDGDHTLFRASSILSIRKWPDFNYSTDYGDEHISTLVDVCGPAIQACQRDVEVESIENEWTRLKTTLRLYSIFIKNTLLGVKKKERRLLKTEILANPSSLSYKKKQNIDYRLQTLNMLEESYGHDYKNLFVLLNYLLALPSGSVEAERGFSCMKMVKNDWRSRLGEENLSDLMMLTLETPEVKHFNPHAAIQLWFSCGQRARRPFYKDELKQCLNPTLSSDSHDTVSDSEADEESGHLEELRNLDEVSATGHVEMDLESDSDMEEFDETLSRRNVIDLQQNTFENLMATSTETD